MLARTLARFAIPPGNSTSTGDFLTFIPELTALRAVAVGVVLLNYALPKYFPGGFIGVDIFFVLSGWLITTILLREFERDNKSMLDTFTGAGSCVSCPLLARCWWLTYCSY